MTRKTQRLLRKLFPYVAVFIIACLIILGVLLFTKPADGEKRTKREKQSETSQAYETDEGGSEIIDIPSAETEAETEPTVPAVDAMNVDQLVSKYYEAKINDDADALNNIVDSDKEYIVSELIDETQIISKYDNFQTYVIPGVTDNYFVVYVRYDIFFNGISTGAPALNHFIVAKDADGFYYIYDKPISGEFQTYLEETENSELVLNLKKEVEDGLGAACAENEDLKYLIAMLNEESAEVETESAPVDILDVQLEDGVIGSEETEAEAAPAEGSEAEGNAL